MKISIRKWFSSGSPWVWLNAGSVSISLVLVTGLLALIAVRGLGHFWPGAIVVANYQVPDQAAFTVAGEIVETEEVTASRLMAAGAPVTGNQEFYTRHLMKVGNRDVTGSDFSWVMDEWLTDRTYPENIVALERREWGNFYGYLLEVKESDKYGCLRRSGLGSIQSASGSHRRYLQRDLRHRKARHWRNKLWP